MQEITLNPENREIHFENADHTRLVIQDPVNIPAYVEVKLTVSDPFFPVLLAPGIIHHINVIAVRVSSLEPSARSIVLM